MPSRRYTEEQFRVALADPAVRTIADLCRALGLVPKGANYASLRLYATQFQIDVDHELGWRRLDRTDERLAHATHGATSVDAVLRALGLRCDGHIRHLVRRRMAVLGLPEPEHFRRAGRAQRVGRRGQRSHSDQELLDALADPAVDGYPLLCAALGLEPHSASHRRLRERALELGVEIPSDWSKPGPRQDDQSSTTRIYPEEMFRAALAAAHCLADAIRAMGDEPTSSTYARASRTVLLHDLDTSHLRPNEAGARRRRQPDAEFFTLDSLRHGGSTKRRLLDSGMTEHLCWGCARREWQGEPIPLELDHIDGDRTNNRLENLRLLCPNCHALTPTYRGRNIGTYAKRASRSRHQR